jgi:predicted SprT family Zn-dependent metalloprotease
MLEMADQLRARFAANDPVRFKYRRRILEGVILRTNPKRAVVCVGKQEYTVPYELLFPMAEDSEERERRIESVLKQAEELLKLHGLKKWQFKFDQSTRRAGCCNYRDKTISIAFDLARSGSNADIHDTILHEIAHALVGKKHNHDAVWKAKAMEIGCSGERTHKLTFVLPRWNVTCGNSCWTYTAARQNSKLICRTCGSKLVYSAFSETV